MDDAEFDKAFLESAFRAIATEGWLRFDLVEAARRADLPIVRVRERFPTRIAVLLRFGLMADQAALAGAEMDGSLRDRLFDLIMRRIDVLQAHRDGVIALFRALPAVPQTALMLSCATERSMAWLFAAAGAPVSRSLADQLRLRGLVAVWLWTVNAWRSDESADLSRTMAALDTALTRADQAAKWLPGRSATGSSEVGTSAAGHSGEPSGDVAAEDVLPATEPFQPPDETPPPLS
jgi:hypothetical protein